MGHSTSQLSQEARTRLKEWFSEKCQQYTCRACGQMAWSIDNSLAWMIDIGGGGKINVADRPTLCPFVVIICKNCGLTDFFSAGVIGVDTEKGA